MSTSSKSKLTADKQYYSSSYWLFCFIRSWRIKNHHHQYLFLSVESWYLIMCLHWIWSSASWISVSSILFFSFCNLIYPSYWASAYIVLWIFSRPWFCPQCHPANELENSLIAWEGQPFLIPGSLRMNSFLLFSIYDILIIVLCAHRIKRMCTYTLMFFWIWLH